MASRQPTIVVDGAHNPAGAEALAVALREFFTWERAHLVLSISANKDVAGIAAELAPLADAAYVARNESERAGDVVICGPQWPPDHPVEELLAAREPKREAS